MGSRAVPWWLVSLALPLVSCTSVTAAISPSTPVATASLAVPATTEPPADVSPTTADAPDDAVPPMSSTLPSSTSSTSPATTVEPPRALRLLFTGDVLMHSPLWRQAVRNGAGAPNFTPMFQHIGPLVQQADLAVCHMETPIAPPGEQWTTDPRYGVPGEVIDALAATGFDHCSTASNHTFDRGIAGVQATIDRFAADGMTQHGMAATPTDNEPVLIDVDGVTIARSKSVV